MREKAGGICPKTGTTASKIAYFLAILKVKKMKIHAVNLVGRSDATVTLPELSPEALAALGARYSRSNMGFDELYDKYQKNLSSGTESSAIDKVFDFIDYGHASIGDMVPIAIFIDDISMHLAYYLFSICPLAGGQETSTRYVKQDKTLDPIYLPSNLRCSYSHYVNDCFDAYKEAYDLWYENAPADFCDRLKRNFAFDRSRYFLPFSALTNVFLVQSGREWARVCKTLRSHYLLEFKELGGKLAEALEEVAPRMVRHASKDPLYEGHLLSEFLDVCEVAIELGCQDLVDTFIDLKVHDPYCEIDLARGLRHHTHRYSPFGSEIRTRQVEFMIRGITIAELRDVNRHRPGEKYAPLIPMGFYCASDRVNSDLTSSQDRQAIIDRLESLRVETWGRTEAFAKHCFENRIGALPYLLPLGTQVMLTFSTSLSHLIYMIQLRTGAGTHFKYREHFLTLFDLLVGQFPTLRDLIEIGGGEPE